MSLLSLDLEFGDATFSQRKKSRNQSGFETVNQIPAPRLEDFGTVPLCAEQAL